MRSSWEKRARAGLGLGLLPAVVGTACLPRAEFTGFDGSGDDLVTVVPSGPSQLGATATTPQFELVFSDNGFHFPAELNMGSPAAARVNMLGDGDNCNEEKRSGVAVYPAYRVDGNQTTGVTAHERIIELAGPVIGKVSLEWSAAYNCEMPTVGVSIAGRSTYTLFPDGRISRFDVVQPTSPFQPNCRCNLESNYYLTSYSAFVYDDAASLVGVPVPDELLGSAPTDRSVCLRQRGHNIGFGWTEDRGRVRLPSVTPVRTVAFVHDFLGSSGASLMPGMYDATTTMIATDEGDCTTTRDRLAPFVQDAPPELKIDGDSVDLGTDGIFAGAGKQAGTGGYVVGPRRVVLEPATAAINAGFAVWLDFGGERARFGVRHSGGAPAGEWFRVQPVASRPGHTIFWFRDALAPGEAITIEPL